ncbi:MAG: hypothetical protein KH292_07730, partial [Collinsella sp.]|nr:hypothetical protein [Collinsella sp.]
RRARLFLASLCCWLRMNSSFCVSVLYLLPMWTGIDVIGRYFDVTVYPLAEQLLNFAIASI